MMSPELLPPFKLDAEATGPQLTQLAKAIQEQGPALGITLVRLLTDARTYKTRKRKEKTEPAREARIFISDKKQQHLLATHHDLKNNIYVSGYRGALELTIAKDGYADRILYAPFVPPAREDGSLRQGLLNLGRNMLDAFIDSKDNAVEEFMHNLNRHLYPDMIARPFISNGHRADPVMDEFQQILSRIPSRPMPRVQDEAPQKRALG